MVGLEVFDALQLAIDRALGALLYFCQRHRTRPIGIDRFAQQTIAHALRGQTAFARFVKTHLIGTGGGDLHHVFLQGTQTGDFTQQAAGFHV